MPRQSPSWLAAQSEFGVDTAARLSGVPEPTLRLHVDQGKVLGVRRLPGGKRLINREGLLAYLRARGMDTKGLDQVERRESPRVHAHLTHVQIRVLDPENCKQLGYGKGFMADYSATGFKAQDVAWEGFLPGLLEPLEFRILDGRLKEACGKARLSWLLLRDGALSLGAGDLQLETPEPWTLALSCAFRPESVTGL